MIGFACAERCPYCRKELGTLAVPPDATVLHHIRCPSRRCRKRPLLIFRIRNGHAIALTGEERSAIVENSEGRKNPEAVGRPLPMSDG